MPDSNVYRIDGDHTHDELENDKNYWNTYAKANQLLLRAMMKAGVTILAGTDANVPTAVPGFSMHDELESLTNAGMTNTEALFSATAAPASWMNIKSGKIAKGYRADLVLLNANPLVDINHTRAIEAVISNGRLLTHDNIENMKTAVVKANNSSRTVSLDAYH